MARLYTLNTFKDLRGCLTVLEKELPFIPRRMYYIYGVPTLETERAGHGHKTNIQALIAICGSCHVEYVSDPKHILDCPDKCLILEPSDWHKLTNFSADCILLVLASEPYDREEYIDDPNSIRKSQDGQPTI